MGGLVGRSVGWLVLLLLLLLLRVQTNRKTHQPLQQSLGQTGADGPSLEEVFRWLCHLVVHRCLATAKRNK